MVEVTKADRDAAARLNGYANWKIFELCPQHDEDWMKLCARDFAIHREAAARLGIIEGLEMAAKALQDDAKLCDCFAREEGECACGAWCEWKTIPSHRAVEIVRALIEESKG